MLILFLTSELIFLVFECFHELKQPNSSRSENDVIYGIVGSETRQTWIGLSNYARLDKSIQWVTSESDYNKVTSYKNWFGKSPDKHPEDLLCAYMMEGSVGIDQGRYHINFYRLRG